MRFWPLPVVPQENYEKLKEEMNKSFWHLIQKICPLFGNPQIINSQGTTNSLISSILRFTTQLNTFTTNEVKKIPKAKVWSYI